MVKVGAYVLYINVIVSTSSFFCSYCSKYDMRRRQVKEDPPKNLMDGSSIKSDTSALA